MSAFDRMVEILTPLNFYELNEGAMHEELKVWAAALDEAEEWINYAARQISAFTVNEEISLYEQLYGANSDVTAGIKERRAGVLAKMRGESIVSAERLMQILQEFNLEGQLEERPKEWKIVISFAIGRPQWFDMVEEALRPVTPAHIELEYIFRSMTYGEMASHTHSVLRGYTHMGIQQYEMGV